MRSRAAKLSELLSNADSSVRLSAAAIIGQVNIALPCTDCRLHRRCPRAASYVSYSSYIFIVYAIREFRETTPLRSWCASDGRGGGGRVRSDCRGRSVPRPCLPPTHSTHGTQSHAHARRAARAHTAEQKRVARNGSATDWARPAFSGRSFCSWADCSATKMRMCVRQHRPRWPSLVAQAGGTAVRCDMQTNMRWTSCNMQCNIQCKP